MLSDRWHLEQRTTSKPGLWGLELLEDLDVDADADVEVDVLDDKLVMLSSLGCWDLMMDIGLVWRPPACVCSCMSEGVDGEDMAAVVESGDQSFLGSEEITVAARETVTTCRGTRGSYQESGMVSGCGSGSGKQHFGRDRSTTIKAFRPKWHRPIIEASKRTGTTGKDGKSSRQKNAYLGSGQPNVRADMAFCRCPGKESIVSRIHQAAPLKRGWLGPSSMIEAETGGVQPLTSHTTRGSPRLCGRARWPRLAVEP